MKNTIKLTLALALFSGIALADDGNQGTGGRTCNPATDPTCHGAAAISNDPKGVSGEGDEITIGGIVIGVIEDATLFLLG
jgi:hypothetical protein